MTIPKLLYTKFSIKDANENLIEEISEEKYNAILNEMAKGEIGPFRSQYKEGFKLCAHNIFEGDED